MKPSPLSQINDKQWRTQDVQAIATLCGLRPTTVLQYRRFYNKPKGPRASGSGRPPKIDPTSIDWTISNNDNARRLGCTPSRIAQLRRGLRKPKARRVRKDEDFC